MYNVAVLVYNEGDMDATISAMDQAIAVAPDEAILYRLKGRAHLAKGEDKIAIEYLKEYISRVPEDDPEAETDRALIEALEAAAG